MNRIISLFILPFFLILLPNISVLSLGIFRQQNQVFYAVYIVAFLILAISLIQTTSKSRHNVKFTISIIDLIVAVFALYVIANNYIFGCELSSVSICQGISLLLIYVLARRLNDKRVVLEALVASGIIQSIIGFLQLTHFMNSNTRLFDVTGSFANPGQLGGFLAINLVIAFGLLAHDKRRYLIAYRIIAIIAIGVMLIITDSRAGWLASAIGIIVMFWSEIEIASKHLSKKRLIAGFIAVGILAITALYSYKKDSADGRLLIWRVSADMIAEKPILGHGADSFSHKYIYYQGEYFASHPESKFADYADNTAYPYNEFIRIWVEYGLIGLLLFASIIVFAFQGKSPDFRHKALKSCFVVLLVYSCFSYPTYIFTLLILYPLLLGLLTSKSLLTVKRSPIIDVTIIVAVCLFSLYTFKIQQLFKEANSLFSLRKTNNKSLLCFVEKNKVEMLSNPLFLNYYVYYVAENSDVSYALDILEKASRVIPSSELLCELGVKYQQSQQYQKAEAAFTVAYNMIPSRIYPQYCKFKLYQEKGQNDLAKIIAAKILSHKNKVQSTKSLKIIGEARRFFQRTE